MEPFDTELAALEQAGQRRALRLLSSAQGRQIKLRTGRTGQQLINFSSNDYLGLAAHERVVAAAQAALARYGHGAGAARLLTGNFELAETLESELVDWLGGEAALLFSSGYHANLAVLPTLYRSGLVHTDELNHASLIDGIRLSAAPKRIYGHLRPPLDEIAPADWLVTETVFSMDGDSPDLAAISARLEPNHLLLDEAHAIGIHGSRGRGLGAPSDIRVGTFGKALGSYGAFVIGPRSVIEILTSRARTFMFTTALPAPVLAASLEGARIARGDLGAARRRHLASLCSLFVDGIDDDVKQRTRGSGPIFSLVLGSERDALAMSHRLEEQGLLVQAIRPPTVPSGTSRLRIVLTASHHSEDVERLCSQLNVLALNDAVRHPVR